MGKNHSYLHDDQTSHFRRAGAERAPHIIEMLHKQGRMTSEDAVERLGRGPMGARLIAGRIALEQAYKERTIEDISTWAFKAKENYQATIDLSKYSNRLNCSYRAKALFELAQLPNHMAIAATGKLPPITTSIKSYEATLEAGQTMVAEYDEAKKINTDTKNTAFMAGIIGETAVLLLGQRYAIENICDGSWLMMPSMYSNDKANTHGHTQNHAWDLEVLSDLDKGLMTDNCIQVKTRASGIDPARRYTDITGIDRLTIDPTLRLKREYIIPGYVIIKECLEAYEKPDSPASQRVADRTELMLDFLDQ